MMFKIIHRNTWLEVHSSFTDYETEEEAERVAALYRLLFPRMQFWVEAVTDEPVAVVAS